MLKTALLRTPLRAFSIRTCPVASAVPPSVSLRISTTTTSASLLIRHHRFSSHLLPIQSFSFMSTMRAVQIPQHGDSSVLAVANIPKPSPKPNEVLVKVAAAGINFIDTYQRSGLYPQKMPFVVGREGAGEIAEVGANVRDFKVGDRVVFLGPSAYAEYAAVSDDKVAKLPGSLSYEKAAAALLQGMTGWSLVRQAYEVKAGDWVLIHAAAGGMGLLLCQMCKLLGANVVGTTSTEAKAALAKKAGADYVVDYSQGYDGVIQKINELTDNKGVHVVLDGVGAATFDASLKAVRLLGTVISFGNASGAVPPISIMRLAEKNVRLMRPTLFNYITTREDFNKLAGDVLKLVDENKLDVNIYKEYPLEDVKQAHDDLEGRKTTGKLILKL